MWQQIQHSDEERCLMQIRDLVLQHKIALEQQWTLFNEYPLAPRISKDIAYYNDYIDHLNGRIQMIRQQTQQTPQMPFFIWLLYWITRIVLARLGLLAVTAVVLLFAYNLYTTLRYPLDMSALMQQRSSGITGNVYLVATNVPTHMSSSLTGTPALFETVAPTVAYGITGQTKALPTSVSPTEEMVQNGAPSAPTAALPMLGERRVVANTDGVMLGLRVAPSQTALSKEFLTEGTVVSVVDSVVDEWGETWLRVAGDDGAVGYINARNLEPLP